jgi:putative aldouronate transport system permease protein
MTREEKKIERRAAKSLNIDLNKLRVNKVKTGDVVFVVLCVLVIIVCVLPMINLLAKSLSGSDYLVKREVYLLPKGFNLSAYKTVLSDMKYIRAFVWTAFLTVVGTILSLTMTILCAYPLIFDNLKGRNAFNVLVTITMFFNAGTIPEYLLMKSLHLLDNPLVLVVPYCLSVFNMIIMKNFFFGIPMSLRESAEMDGASFFQVLRKIYIPLSKPVIATLALFYAVGRWNGYSDALMFVKEPKYYPIQLLLYNIINNINSVDVATQEGFTTPGLSESLKAAVVMFSTIPILCIYPWLQQYFISGVTVGAVKE